MNNAYLESIVKQEGGFPENEFASCAREHFDDPNELYAISEAYCRIGRFEEASALYKRLSELKPLWIDVLDFHARARWAMHDYAGARDLWRAFLERRENDYRRFGIPLNFYTVDDVFTSAFGNFTHFYPMDQSGYLTENDEFFYHDAIAAGSVRSILPSHGKSVSNEALRNRVFERIKDRIPSDILPLLAQDDYVTRVPYYCGTDLKRQPLHHHPAYAEKMLSLIRAGRAAKLRLQPEEIDDCERRLKSMGINSDRPIVCVHARESGYWARTGDRTHSVQNVDIATFIPAIQLLADSGYQVIRLGDKSMTPLPALKGTLDYGLSEYRSDALDLYLMARSAFLLGSSSGPWAVASMFNVPLLATNWIAVHKIPFLPKDLVLVKRFKHKNRNTLLSFDELMNLDYGEYLYYNLDRKNVEVVDNTAGEILSATKEMLERLSESPNRKFHNFVASTFRGSMKRKFRGHPVVSEARFARACYFS